MKALLVCLGASVLTACGGPSNVNVTIIVDRPGFGDNSCVGVAGFEVIVSPAGQAPHTERVVGPAPILDAAGCALPHPISVADLDIDASVFITINGYDGSGTKMRVTGSAQIPNLHAGEVRLQMDPVPQRPNNLLVFNRSTLLEGAQLQDFDTMVVAPQMGSTTSLLSVSRRSAGVFMDPEPGAYGIDGLQEGQPVTVTFTGPGGMVKTPRLTVTWDGRNWTLR